MDEPSRKVAELRAEMSVVEGSLRAKKTRDKRLERKVATEV